MLVMNSYFLSESARYQLESKVMRHMNDMNECDILVLDDRQLMELADQFESRELIG